MKTLYSALIGAATLVALPACDDYLDINDNPNAAIEAPINGLLAYTTSNTALNQFRVSNAYTANYVQYIASPNKASSTDIYEVVSFSGTWGDLYDAMTNAYDMIELGEERGGTDHVGVGKILMAINLGLVVDSWGDAPYSEAFTGDNITPGYDSAEDLYAEIQSLLDEAIAAFAQETLVDIDKDSDLIHGGNIDAWTKTAYALKARYGLHLSETGNYDAAAVLANVERAYTSNADDAQIKRYAVRNPWAGVARGNDNLILGGWLSDQFVSALNGTTYSTFDPRLPLLTDTTDAGTYLGTINGAGRRGDGTKATESYLELTGALSGESSPLIIISYAELKFIEAEAALDAGQGARARTAFLEGIRASMAKIGVGTAAAEAYVMSNYGSGAGATVTLDQIFREKYVALFLSPETWVDARRYDYMYKDFTLPQNAALQDFPRRVPYPDTELTRNGDNAPKGLALTERIFWDQ